MKETVQKRFRQTTTALMAVAVVLSVFGSIGTVAAAPGVSVTQTADSTTVTPGGTVTFTTDVSVTDLNGMTLDAQLPDGWTITEQSTSSGQGNYAPHLTDWVWLTSDEDTVTYTVQVPESATEGDHTVSATGGGTDPNTDSYVTKTDQTTITVQQAPTNAQPTVSISGPTSAQVGEEVTFTASASDDGSIQSYEWDFGGDGTATGASVSHAFSAAGDYTVEVTVTDDEGVTAMATQTVSVTEASDSANFQVSNLSAPSSAMQGDSVTVSATVENAGDEEATQTVEFSLDGNVVDSQSVTLAGGESQTITFTLDTTDISADTYSYGVATQGDGATGQFTVELPALNDESDPPTNMDDDVVLEDVNGDGAFNAADAQALFSHRNADVVTNNPEYFDFNGDGLVNVADAQAAFYQAVLDGAN